jgi:hypothetical protein
MVGCIVAVPAQQTGQLGGLLWESDRACPRQGRPRPPQAMNQTYQVTHCSGGTMLRRCARCVCGAQAVRSMRVRQNSLRVWATLLSGA